MSSRRLDLAPERPEYRTSTLLIWVVVVTAMIAIGTCLGIQMSVAIDRLRYASLVEPVVIDGEVYPLVDPQ